MSGAWASYFEQLASPDWNSFCSSTLIDVETRFLGIFQLNELNRQNIVVSAFLVQEVIKTLSRGKAAQLVRIVSFLNTLFMLPCIIELSQCLALLFIAMISLCYMYAPPSLCNSFVFPIPNGKGLDYSNPNNYRSISVSSNFSKIFEAILLTFISDYILNHISMGYRVASERDMVLPTLPVYSRKPPGRLVMNVMLLF